MRLAAGTIVLLVARAGSGCVSFDPATEKLAEDGSDVNDLTARVTELAAAFVPATGTTFNVATLSAASVLFAPAACFSAGDVEGTLGVTFKDCSGPWGLVHLQGSMMVEAGVPGPSHALALAISATGLQIGEARVSFSATATITSSGSARTLSWDPVFMNSRTARGRSFDSLATGGAWSMAWNLGAACVSFASAQSMAAVGSSTVIVGATGLVRCAAVCPNAGMLTISNGVALSDTLTYVGTDVAAFQSSGGSNDIELACGLSATPDGGGSSTMAP